MTGVEILNTIYEYGSLIHPIWNIFFAIAGLITATASICVIDNKNMEIMWGILTVILFIGVVVCTIGTVIKTDKVIDTKYQVIISEEVNMVEFMDKYEILDQEGKIYKVREKNNKKGFEW